MKIISKGENLQGDNLHKLSNPIYITYLIMSSAKIFALSEDTVFNDFTANTAVCTQSSNF